MSSPPADAGSTRGLVVVYETHSTTVDNERGIATGWLPGELSAVGVDQAAELGARRRDDGIDLVLTSDLHRAVRTAEIAFGDTGIPIVTDRRLRECDYGALTGGPVARIRPSIAFLDKRFPGGESYRDTCRRTADVLDGAGRSRRSAARADRGALGPAVGAPGAARRGGPGRRPQWS